ncbi:MAG: Gfo/Idh/MocA family oxidoreductase [Bacillota bacterium]|nr:Gfo/Idh/MocA family oxidoreductase [Bacillota bacterium]
MKSKIAVIGAGTYGAHVLNVLSSSAQNGDIDLVAVADIDPERVGQASRNFGIRGYLNYDEMLDKEQPDAVAVVTPDYLHKAVTLAAAQRNVHVLCQKPIATDSREGCEMIDEAAKAGILLYVDYHKRFDPAHRALKRDIARGRLGTILYGDVYMEDRIEVPSVWFTRWAHLSSPAWFLGTHFYDLVSWLMQSRPTRVFAHGNKVKLKSMGIDTYDHVSALVVYANGATITFHASWILPGNFPSIVNQQIRLVGSEGICEIDSQDRGMLTSYAADTSSQVHNPFSKTDTDDSYGIPMSGYTCESILHFVRILKKLKGGQSLQDLQGQYPSGAEALTATILCEAIHRSLLSGAIELIGPDPLI